MEKRRTLSPSASTLSRLLRASVVVFETPRPLRSRSIRLLLLPPLTAIRSVVFPPLETAPRNLVRPTFSASPVPAARAPLRTTSSALPTPPAPPPRDASIPRHSRYYYYYCSPTPPPTPPPFASTFFEPPPPPRGGEDAVAARWLLFAKTTPQHKAARLVGGQVPLLKKGAFWGLECINK